MGAGIEKLDKYGEFSIIYDLAKGDPTKYKEVSKLKAVVCYTTLAYQKELGEYEKRLQENDRIDETTKR